MFERPAYVVLGKTDYDQNWIDGNIEGGIGGCKWARPAPRPPELDTVAGYVPPAKPIPPKRKKLFQRIKERIKPAAAQAAPAPLQPQPEIRHVAPGPTAPPPAPPQAQQSPVDALLHRRK